MHPKRLLVAGAFAIVNAAPPATSTLSTTMSGVFPLLRVATGFTDIETINYTAKAFAIVNATPPAISTLFTTMSRVLPILPVATGFTSVKWTNYTVGAFTIVNTTRTISTLSKTISRVVPIIPVATSSTGPKTIGGETVYDGPILDGFAGPANVQDNNPPATYMAVLPMMQFGNPGNSTNGTESNLIAGSITAMANSNGTGIFFHVDFSGFPSESKYGPFAYHIHNKPVPPDGNCTGTLGVLDPTDRGEYHPCQNTKPETCQAGDLAGKHGNITSTRFTSSYLELYLSTTPGSPYFFGDKSVVIYMSGATRLTCANFTLLS